MSLEVLRLPRNGLAGDPKIAKDDAEDCQTRMTVEALPSAQIQVQTKNMRGYRNT